ncbi:DUF262 domain-containing protein [Polaribacter sp.]|jgi:hypothetical protein|nr:DUF262 domain-containing protein [Polaribacter sp.]
MQIKGSNWTVSHIKENNTLGLINYSPEFQRRYVWTDKQKVYLIDTLLNDFSLPKLYVRQILDEKTEAFNYEIIDGQQRVTTIMNFVNGDFPLLRKKHPKPEFFDDKYEGKFYKELNLEDRIKILNYTIAVDLVEGSRDEITEMFLRLNLSSSPLNKQEIINSQYFGDFKKLVQRITNDFLEQVVDDKILTAASIKRMADYKLVTDCLISQLVGITDKSKSFEKIYQTYDDWDVDEMDDHYNRFRRIYNLITINIFENEIKTTRFKSINQFISVFEFFYDCLYNRGMSLQKEQFNSVKETLIWLSKEMKMDGKGIGKDWYDYSQQGGDSQQMRYRRKEILDKILIEFFNVKDSKRNFTPEDRIIVWNSGQKICKICGDIVKNFEDFDLDHILPYDRGGKTILSNSQLTHKSCNRSKGKKI